MKFLSSKITPTEAANQIEILLIRRDSNQPIMGLETINNILYIDVDNIERIANYFSMGIHEFLPYLKEWIKKSFDIPNVYVHKAQEYRVKDWNNIPPDEF